MDRETLVYVDLGTPCLVGRCHIAAKVGAAVSRWRSEAARLGLTAGAIERMESAFEHQDLRQALNC
jgi:hypothetical protein